MMTDASPEISSISPIASSFDGILLDAYGVFWGGGDVGLLPGAREIMEKLVSKGKIVGILSNSTQLASVEINKFKRNGLFEGTHFQFVITSGEIARCVFLHQELPFETPSNKFWLFGGVHPRFASHEAIFQGSVYSETSNIDEADFIYISIPHIDGQDQIDPELFRAELERVKQKNLPMVCPNPDLFAHEGKPARAVVRQGSIARLYEELGGEVFYIGKPHNKAYTVALEQFGKYQISDPKNILMIGDTPETDIRGARSFGMPSALVTHTGIMSERIAHHGLEEALRALPSHDTPDYLMTRFADEIS